MDGNIQLFLLSTDPPDKTKANQEVILLTTNTIFVHPLWSKNCIAFIMMNMGIVV